MLDSLFTKVEGLQDCCKTYLLHALLKFYISLGKTLKNFINFFITYVLLNIVKYKVMFTEAYLEPSRTSTMELFYFG